MSDSRDVSTNDADLAIIRFHRWALGFAGPGRHWVLSAVRLGLIAVGTALAINIAVMAARISFNYPMLPTRERSLLEMVFGIVLFAPLIETALLVLMYKMTKPYLGIGGFALVNTTLFGLAHIPTQGIPVGATILFLMMSYQYASYRHALGPERAFAGVAVSHGVNNGVAVLLIAASTWLDP